MKRIFVFLLALIMCLSLAACGEDETSENNKTSGNKEGFTSLKVDKDKRISDIEITGMKMGKEQYDVGETIKVTVTWKGTPAEDAWIGIIPADTPHGSEEKNDEYDVEYLYFADMKSGDTFVFESIELEPGDYTMRVNESDAGGAELAWCAFSVKGSSTKGGDSDPQGGSETASAPNTPADKNPEGKGKYVMEGGVIYYPTDTWEKGDFGGIQPKNCTDESLVVRFGTVSGSVDKQIEIFKNDYPSYKSAEKMTIANHNAAKLIYVGSLGTHMEIIFDTPYTNDEFYSAYHIMVRVSEDNTAFFDDPTLWEIIESFYYDPSLKYSF